MDENNCSSDDEIQDSSMSPKSGGKKLKLNDGSSQDSFKETVLSTKEENVDSGISADKSESTSSDDRAAGPSNEVVVAAPSGSNVRTIFLNMRRPRRNRNYRKRKTPDRDSDSNDSSRDSDDLSAEENSNNRAINENSNSETESDDLRRMADEYLTPGSDDSNSGSSSSSNSNDSYGSEHLIPMHSGDTDTDDDDGPFWSRSDDNDANEENKGKTPAVLTKQKPKHSYFLLREIINREMGLTLPWGKVSKEDVIFGQKFYGSLHAVYRLKKIHNLNKHRGCVNSINFHPEGRLLASGSDDTNVIIWDWARNQAVQTIKTGHKSNVFQSKFLHLNARSQLNIVTCSRDGQVRLLQWSPSGGPASRRRLASHSRAAHKLHVSAAEPHLILSAGEDGLVVQSDVRAEHASRLFQVKERGVTVPLYSVSGHPMDMRELIVAGRDKFIRMYDKRKSTKPIALYCPSTFRNDLEDNVKKKSNLSMMHLTCAIYNHDGSEIIGSYNDEDIYLFDAKHDVYDKENPSDERDGYTHRYSGHRNSATFKGVAVFGPKSEYIVSGSDCGHIYIWEKNSEALVQWLHGDVNGVVNCIDTHPSAPVMASSGLDKDVKIWLPRSHKEPTFEGLEKVVRENGISQLRSPLFNDFLPTLYNAWRGENRLFSDEEAPPYGGNIEFDANVCTTF